MSRTSTPLDDSVHLEEMDYFPDSDTAQIISPDREDGQEDGVNNSVSNTSASDSCKTTDEKGAPIIGKRKAYITVATLLFINLLNYMDRFTIAGKHSQV